jgi:hypothetical protein
MVRQWLQAGVIEDGRFTPTEEGAPQGGVISPLILNVALHGMEAAVGVRYHQTGARAGKVMPGCPTVIRYADDLLALCHTREQAEQVKARLAEWLQPRGLVFNEDKTQITHLEQGVDFLGFAIRRYPNGKLLTKPSNDAPRRIRRRLSAELKALRGANADALIAKLNPIITGWAAYRTSTLRLLRVQHGRCPLCRGLLLHADCEPQCPREWEQWFSATRKAISKRAIVVWGAGTPDERVAHRLIHANCHRRISAAVGPHFEAAHEPSGLA